VLFEEREPCFVLDRTQCLNAPIGKKSDSVIKDLHLVFNDVNLNLSKWNKVRNQLTIEQYHFG
jgi:hypothetical protein